LSLAGAPKNLSADDIRLGKVIGEYGGGSVITVVNNTDVLAGGSYITFKDEAFEVYRRLHEKMDSFEMASGLYYGIPMNETLEAWGMMTEYDFYFGIGLGMLFYKDAVVYNFFTAYYTGMLSLGDVYDVGLKALPDSFAELYPTITPDTIGEITDPTLSA